MNNIFQKLAPDPRLCKWQELFNNKNRDKNVRERNRIAKKVIYLPVLFSYLQKVQNSQTLQKWKTNYFIAFNPLS